MTFLDRSYDDYKNLIRKMRKNNVPWNDIKYANYSGIHKLEKLKEFLIEKVEREFWKELTIEKWFELVDEVKAINVDADKFIEKSNSSMLAGEKQNNNTSIPMEDNSSWQNYKRLLSEKGIDEASILNIEKECISILKKLDANTDSNEAVKGLVVGNVQSGKTANMAGLMSMAADHGWNMFIVLSGLVENLREQTQKRLIDDLGSNKSNVHWRSLSNVQKNTEPGNKSRNMFFSNVNRQDAHLYVCLKNKTRLINLHQWLHDDLNTYNNMRILVIDDEADQGSINTANVDLDEERKTINKLIVNLVENKSHNGNSLKKNAKAMNYVSYTATPYANFLNETGRESLYPKDFIKTLSTSNRYFGPKEIFGVEEESYGGLNIVRTIDDEDSNLIKQIHSKEIFDMPKSLIDSICWFLSSVASLRLHNYKKPLSMLIHTSHRKSSHSDFYHLIKGWIENTPKDQVLRRCKRVWEYEKEQFTLKDLKNNYANYGALDGVLEMQSFNIIEPAIITLIKKVTNIPLNEEQDLTYHKNIHLCVDNSDNNNVTDSNMYLRLAYPNKEQNKEIDTATAFIVIGGTTLSRGLTIEGLISTYFVRGTTQADTLMQMGRWFGYRINYELYPRIWMEDETRLKFDFLTSLEYEMRLSLKSYDTDSASPIDIAPKIKNTPGVSWLRVTAKNRMQSAESIDFDYSGSSSQTILFNNNEKELKSNFEITEKFLGGFKNQFNHVKNKILIYNVSFTYIEQYLKELKYPSSSRLFNRTELPKFLDWIMEQSQNGDLDNWNVIVSGISPSNDSEKNWTIGNDGPTIGMVNRSRKIGYTDKKLINIGVLRAPADLTVDIDRSKLSEDSKKIVSKSSLSAKKSKLWEIRKESGLEKTPQLIIYPIDKNSVKSEQSKNKRDEEIRADLKAEFDLIGVAITLPNTDKLKNDGALRANIKED